MMFHVKQYPQSIVVVGEKPVAEKLCLTGKTFMFRLLCRIAVNGCPYIASVLFRGKPQ